MRYLFKVLVCLLAVASAGLVHGQEVRVNRAAYTAARQNGLLERQAWLIVQYTPASSPSAFQTITSVTLSRAELPANFTRFTSGYSDASISAANTTEVWLLYGAASDVIFATVDQYQNKANQVKNSLAQFGLGTLEERQAAFDRANEEGSLAVPVTVTPLATVDINTFLQPLQGFLTSGLAIWAAVFFVVVLFSKGLVKFIKGQEAAKLRVDTSLAKSLGTTRAKLDEIRQDYNLLDRGIRKNMDFGWYAEQEARVRKIGRFRRSNE